MNLIKYWISRLMEDPEERERKLESYVMEASKGITLAMELGRPTERTAGSLGTTQSLCVSGLKSIEQCLSGEPDRILLILSSSCEIVLHRRSLETHVHEPNWNGLAPLAGRCAFSKVCPASRRCRFIACICVYHGGVLATHRKPSANSGGGLAGGNGEARAPEGA